MELDTTQIPTPCYVIDESALEENLKILKAVQQKTGCKILLALKGFAMFSVFPQIRQYLSGIAASSLHEARLGFEAFGKEVHVYSPAYKPSEFDELLSYCDHMVFNSFSQWRYFKPFIEKSSKPLKCGIRINPEHSEVNTPLYDPCAPFSRLGITRQEMENQAFDGITGLHFHTLCEKNADALERTLKALEENFSAVIDQMEWMNLGGGHHITRKDYDKDLLCQLIDRVKHRYSVEVYLEPGEAVVLNTGVLVSSVLDIIHNRMGIAILDTSATAHMPDVIEMPYRPEIIGAGLPGEYPHTYRLGGLTCLAGDIIGDYSFKEPLQIGSKLVFLDMAHYTMVKNNTFNGVRLPSIAIQNRKGDIRIVKQFGYEDYRNRLS
jgi:carboxynorspermidine decarboxylase